MQCVQCATPVPDDAKYCQSCGSLVSDAEGQARASAAIDASGLLHMEQLLREDTAGQFDIRGPLGRGGMAMVYLATETALNRKVAIKVLPPELTFGHGVERFKREAKTAAALDHPNIIPVYRVATGGKLFWYAMKFLEGRSLDDMLKKNDRMPLDQTIVILDQVADALDYAHEHKVVHRDIKPANVMLDSRNRVVVTDFGIAKALTEGALTASGSVIGTPFFMSPEQGMGKPVSGASDQYSVAVMAYRMLSGHVPFDGDSAVDILHKHCMTPAPPLETAEIGLPDHVAWAVNKALEKDATKRFPTVRAFVEALKHPTAEAEISTAATVMSAPAVRPDMTRTGAGQKTPSRGSLPTQMMGPQTGKRPPVEPKAPKKGKGALIGGLLVVVLAGGGAGWFFLQPRAAAPSATPTGTVAVAPTGTTAQPAAQDANPPAQTAGPPAEKPASQPPQTPIRSGPSARPTRNAEKAPARGAPSPTPPPTKPAAQPTSAAPTRGVIQILVTGGFADVSIDGVSLGTKTRMQDSLLAGGHLVHFERSGFASIDTNVVITAGSTTSLRVTLAPKQE